MFAKLKEKLSGSTARMTGSLDRLEAVCAAVVLVGAADGDMSDDEAAVGLDRLTNHDTISKTFSTTQIETAFDKQVKRAKQGMSGRLALRREIEEVKAKSSADECEMLLVIAIDVAAADGSIGDKEMVALKSVAQLVGLDVNRYLA